MYPSNLIKNRTGYWYTIAAFIVAKLTIHFICYDNYELHRDEYLYYSYSHHPAWGYIAAPPSIGVFAKIATSLFGNTTFALRFFPAIIGALNFLLIGLMIKELKGGIVALAIACLAFLLSPAYLHTNTLFQPVSFNQFYWLLSGYLILLLINRNKPVYWILIGIVFGLAFLNKYSVIFFIAGFIIGMLSSEHRKLFLSKYFPAGLMIGGLIILPNIIWQYNHNWPVVHHMSELRERQLVHVQLSGFLIDQFKMNAQAIWIWITSLVVLIVNKKERKYQVFAWIYLIIIVLLMLGKGKSYYTLGYYPILFAFGAYVIDKYLLKYRKAGVVLLVLFIFTVFFGSLSFSGIPFYGFDKVAKKDGYRWEDGKYYDVPQDMADMTGWNEIGEAVNKVYLELNEKQRKDCMVFCGHYGQAGAVLFHGKKVDLPHPACFNASFIFWNPDSIRYKYFIWVYHEPNIEDHDAEVGQYFEKIELKHVVNNPYFRERGTRIYLCINANEHGKASFSGEAKRTKEIYRRP